MRPSRSSTLAVSCAALLALLYFAPVSRDVFRLGLAWPIWIDHAEGLCDTSIGRWLVLPPHQPLVDGSSGEFPIYYPGLSDTLLNVVSELGHWPAITVQAALYGPALGFVFLLANYLSLAAVLRDRRAALWASLLISLGGNGSFWNRHDPVAGLPLNTILHVPFQALSLGTAQSLGWVLFLPCLSLTHLAYRGFARSRAVALGLLLGVLFYTHTLTFVNVAAAQLAYLVLANALERPRARGFPAWAALLGLAAIAFVGLTVMRPVASFGGVVALGALVLAITFACDPRKTFYLWTYGTASLVVLPYLLLLARHARAVAFVQDTWSQVQMAAVSLPGFLLFFSAYLAASVLALTAYRDRAVMTWLAAVLLATGFLALNHFWHWFNHPYRFAIHLIFPLGILAALGLAHGRKLVAVALGVWLGAVCAFDVAGFAAGRREHVSFRAADPEREAFLRVVREATAPHEGSGQRILDPAEVSYPRGVVQAAMLMGYSRIPGFVPDYRHVLWRERYDNRMGLFCFLFPGYPSADLPFARHACEEDLDPDPAFLAIREPRLKSGILPVYSISFAGAPGKPFAVAVKDASARYGWPLLAQTTNSALARTEVARLPGVARVVSAASSAGTLTIRLAAERPGLHVLVLGGRRLAVRAPVVRVDGRTLDDCQRSGNWAVCSPEIAAGEHSLELPSHESGPDPEADYLYFVALVHRDESGRYLSLPPGL